MKQVLIVLLLCVALCSCRSQAGPSIGTQDLDSSDGVALPSDTSSRTFLIFCQQALGICLLPPIANVTVFMLDETAQSTEVFVADFPMLLRKTEKERLFPFFLGRFQLSGKELASFRQSMETIFAAQTNDLTIKKGPYDYERGRYDVFIHSIARVKQSTSPRVRIVAATYMPSHFEGECEDMRGNQDGLGVSVGISCPEIHKAFTKVGNILYAKRVKLLEEEADRCARWNLLLESPAVVEDVHFLDMLEEGSGYFEVEGMIRPYADSLAEMRAFLSRLIQPDFWSGFDTASFGIGVLRAGAVAALVNLGCVPLERVYDPDYIVKSTLIQTLELLGIASEFVFTEALKDNDSSIRACAIRAIFRLCLSSRRALRAVAQLEKDTCWNNALDALKAQALLGDKVALWKHIEFIVPGDSLANSTILLRLEQLVSPGIRPVMPPGLCEEERRECWRTWYLDQRQNLYWNEHLRVFEASE